MTRFINETTHPLNHTIQNCADEGEKYWLEKLAGDLCKFEEAHLILADHLEMEVGIYIQDILKGNHITRVPDAPDY